MDADKHDQVLSEIGSFRDLTSTVVDGRRGQVDSASALQLRQAAIEILVNTEPYRLKSGQPLRIGGAFDEGEWYRVADDRLLRSLVKQRKEQTQIMHIKMTETGRAVLRAALSTDRPSAKRRSQCVEARNHWRCTSTRRWPLVCRLARH